MAVLHGGSRPDAYCLAQLSTALLLTGTPTSRIAVPSLIMVSTFQPVGSRQRKRSYWLELSHMATPG